uniref:Uncharacterized protein n=1 Tax=Wuchereria bancrofti TaxID=6293 RepID=A0AAF5PSI0_WUCBA
MNYVIDGRSYSFLIALIAINSVISSYSIPRQKSYHQLDLMTKRCFRTICKDWIHECHWFCDLAKGRPLYDRCMECLSWKGKHCYECFDL